MIRVETDADGVYEAHVTKDGKEYEVKVDKNFTVTAVEEHTGRGRHGGGMGGQDGTGSQGQQGQPTPSTTTQGSSLGA